MLFRAATTIALLAANVAAQSQPYKLVTGPVLGVSLARRNTYGYQPEQSVCGDGSTCAEACGSGYEACGSNDGDTHCYNPAINQSCCSDGTGNSCDEGYYCTHDTKLNTWCCPDDLDLVECAKKFKVDELETNSITISSAEPTTTSVSSSSSSKATYAKVSITKAQLSTTSTTIKVTSTYIPHTHKASSDVVKTEVDEYTTTVCPTPTAAYTTAWTGSNSTISGTAPTKPYETPGSSASASASGTSSVPPVATGGAAAASSVSALLLAAAGLMALL